MNPKTLTHITEINVIDKGKLCLLGCYVQAYLTSLSKNGSFPKQSKVLKFLTLQYGQIDQRAKKKKYASEQIDRNKT